jgi:hypothetical protein
MKYADIVFKCDLKYVMVLHKMRRERDSSHQAIPNSGHVTGYPKMTFCPYKMLTGIRNRCKPEIVMKKTGCSECNSKGIFHTKRPEDRNENDWDFGAQLT